MLAGAAFLLLVTPAFARGGGGGHGGGSHGGGGHVSGGHVGGSAPHYSAPHYSAPHYSAPHYSAPHYSAPHYAAPAYRGGIGIHGAAPMRAPIGGYHGYIGGGRGSYMVGGRVPAFHGGPRGRVWWGPHYGWRVPAYWGGWYRPYGAYWGVGYWVTDWVMLDYLAAEEARRMEYYNRYGVAAVPVESAPLDVGIREELRAQIAEVLSQPVPPTTGTSIGPGNTLVVNDPRIAQALGAPHHVFVVSGPVAVADRTHGGTCNVSGADLLRSSSPIPSGQAAADVTVGAAKSGSCPVGTTVGINVIDLVHFEEALLDRVSRGAAAAKAADAEVESPPPATGAPQVPNAAPQMTPAPSQMAPSQMAPSQLAPATPGAAPKGLTDPPPVTQDLSTTTPPISGGMSL